MSLKLPPREGVRPETGNTIPHLQHTQKSPDHVRDEFKRWALQNLPGVQETATRISVPSTRAFWLSEEIEAQAHDAFMPPAGGREFAHLHLDGSMHLCTSDEAVEEIVSTGWGEPHPLRSKGVNEVLFYAPRDRAELEFAQCALVESYRYATGRTVSVQQG